jgi:ketosteroid isomerase-like protein
MGLMRELTMDGRQPEQISEVLATLLDKGDTGNVADLYEDEAVFADFDATVNGLDDILGAHQQFSDAGKRLILNESVVFEVDDIALVHWSWTVRSADGSSREGISAEVLRRQPDGTWKFIIDNSHGTALVGSP